MSKPISKRKRAEAPSTARRPDARAWSLPTARLKPRIEWFTMTADVLLTRLEGVRQSAPDRRTRLPDEQP